MATLNGIDMFHLVTAATTPAPMRRQINRYPGVNGLESKRMGTDGKQSTVVGWLIGVTTVALNAAEGVLQTYVEDGRAYVFVDNYGNSWDWVFLHSYEFTSDRIMPVAAAALPGYVGFCRPYKAVLIHLI